MEEVTEDPWFRKAALYHIYPLSFADSNGDGYGDIRGIIDHLDYLNDGTAESLGITAVWLSPIYLSPMADWGYDVADHQAIDPRFGTMDDFDELLGELHRRGMKLLLDFVPNHTSILHRWFVESMASRDSAKRDWYIWADPGKDGGLPNNWLSYFGGPAWDLDPKTGQYYLHTFLPEQPDLNWRNPDVREAMLEVLRFWLNKGVDGFRTDAVLGLIKDDQLRDDEPNPNYKPGVNDPAEEFLRVHSSGQSELSTVINTFCDVLAEKNARFLLSEAYLNIPGMHQMYLACSRHPVHAPFNFNLMSLDWSADAYRQFIDAYEASLGPDDWPNYVLGNHDRHRLASRVGHQRARLIAMLEMTLRGLPVIYYGDELGLPDSAIHRSDVRDPWELRVPNRGFGRDPERTPLPWNNNEGHGFTTGTPWLPIGAAAASANVDSQDHDPESSLSLYRHMINLRSQSAGLVEGDYRSLDVENAYAYAYVRETEQQRFLIILNFDLNEITIKLKGKFGKWVAGTHQVQGDGEMGQAGDMVLQPYEGRVYELRRGDAAV
jgi:alpha-glucosidase